MVSLLASATEIVCALEAGEMLVGRSHECDNPAWVTSLPACSEPAFDVTLSSGEIDREVKRRFRSGEPLYRIHTDRIRELAPDLIVAQSHCEVCAVTPGDVERSGASIPGARLLSLNASSVEEIFSTIMELARALRLDDRGRALVARERARLDALRAGAARCRRRSVAVLEWTDPILPMGNWGPELVDIVNGEVADNAEVFVVAPCGFDLERTMQEVPVLERCSWWNAPGRKVALADGNRFFKEGKDWCWA